MFASQHKTQQGLWSSKFVQDVSRQYTLHSQLNIDGIKYLNTKFDTIGSFKPFHW